MAAVNYTEDQVATIVDQYTDGVDITVIAAGVQKSVRSVIAKLSREGIYKAVVRESSSPVVRKTELVETIGRRIHSSVPSLVKASKSDLVLLLAAING